MKNIIIAAVALLGLSLLPQNGKAADIPVGLSALTATTSVISNSATKLTLSDLGSKIAAMHIANVSGTETAYVGFVSGTTTANYVTTILPSASITFPSSTYPFIPGGGVYAITGGGSAVTNTVRVNVQLKSK